MLHSIVIYCGDVHESVSARLQANICLSSEAPRQPDSPPSRFFDGAGDHLGSWALPSRAFKEASTSSSVRPCLTSQTTVSYHQAKYRTTLGKMITQIWSFSSCLVSSHPFQRVRNPPPSLFLSEAASALSPAVYPHPLVASSSSNFSTTYVLPASLSQRKWHIKMIIFEELMHNLQDVLSSIRILLFCLMIFCFLCAFAPTLVNIFSKNSDSPAISA